MIVLLHPKNRALNKDDKRCATIRHRLLVLIHRWLFYSKNRPGVFSESQSRIYIVNPSCLTNFITTLQHSPLDQDQQCKRNKHPTLTGTRHPNKEINQPIAWTKDQDNVQTQQSSDLTSNFLVSTTMTFQPDSWALLSTTTNTRHNVFYLQNEQKPLHFL